MSFFGKGLCLDGEFFFKVCGCYNCSVDWGDEKAFVVGGMSPDPLRKECRPGRDEVKIPVILSVPVCIYLGHPLLIYMHVHVCVCVHSAYY